MKQVAQNEVTNTIKNRIKALESKLPSNETYTIVTVNFKPCHRIIFASMLHSTTGSILGTSTTLDNKD
ncbi:hypothetical protein Smp_198150 [Schistosoma mansoni]|uniref:hypothetical protein n=1 Tax=Schistosoma mansoni TaxID=6183 RepID=UPI00022DC4CC|nr:hypothetical protein Smp_198150 [Schistosoma mansoni]|eukprot:XP_018652128.1 hypothetical protein Smp_198150 [Schistosoma mansoni]